MPGTTVIHLEDMDGDVVHITDEGDHFEVRISDGNTPQTDYRCAKFGRYDLGVIASHIIAHLADPANSPEPPTEPLPDHLEPLVTPDDEPPF